MQENRMRKLLFTGIFLAFLASACAAQIPGRVTLKPGESVSSADGDLKVTFVEVLEDSRCPADAVCVWAGQVQVLVEVAYGTEIQQYTLTADTLLEGDVNSITVGEYTIKLEQVDPYPLASQLTNPADYQVTLTIES
jgi:hypothetical protein